MAVSAAALRPTLATLPTRRRWVAAVAAIASLSAYVVAARRGAILDYPDSIAHLLISRRVVASSTPGLAQLGNVWLPLPHLLTLPFAAIGSLFYSGLAGSIVSMAAFVATAVLLQRTVMRLTGSCGAGWVAASVFMTNPAVLYLQATPMTETLLFACVTGAVYAVVCWGQSGRYEWLAVAGVAALLGTMSRYEGWIVLAGLAAVVVIGAARRDARTTTATTIGGRLAALGSRGARGAAEGSVVFFLAIAAGGIGLWLLWNQVLFGDWLGFQRGTYAKPSLWVSAGEPAVGDLGVALRTYGYAVTGNVGPVLLALAAVGLVVLVWRSGLDVASMAVGSLVLLAPFYVLSLYLGQRPLHVTQISGDLYNTRFGLLMILPVAIGLGVLANLGAGRAWHLVPKVALVAVAVGSAALSVHGGDVSVVREAEAFESSPTEEANAAAASWWRANYDDGLVLMEGFGNETVIFESRIPLDRFVYEGSYQRWEPALTDPAESDITWIYLRADDEVHDRLAGTPAIDRYQQLFDDGVRQIFRLRDRAPAGAGA